MDTLWAPWRMEYIQSAAASGCVFCPMQDRGKDRERLILWRGTHTFCVMNRYPYNPGHLLVLPYQHTDDLLALDGLARDELMWLLAQSIAVVQKTLLPEGVNCGMNLGKMAGAGVLGHAHFHILPRWNGDTNFLPLLGATKSMPEYLDDTYQTLAGGFAALSKGA